MFRQCVKVVALVFALGMLMPPPQVAARDNAGKFIAAAILGAVIASAVSDRDHNRYRQRDGRVYDPGYFAPVAPPVGYVYSPESLRYSGCNEVRRRDPYRYNSGYGYDRFGPYYYDTGRFSTGRGWR